MKMFPAKSRISLVSLDVFEQSNKARGMLCIMNHSMKSGKLTLNGIPSSRLENLRLTLLKTNGHIVKPEADIDSFSNEQASGDNVPTISTWS